MWRLLGLALLAIGFVVAGLVEWIGIDPNPPAHAAVIHLCQILAFQMIGVAGTALALFADRREHRERMGRVWFPCTVMTVGFVGAAAFRCSSYSIVSVYTANILSSYVVGALGVFGILRRHQQADESRGAIMRFLAGPVGRASISLILVLYLGVLFDAGGAFFRLATHGTALRQASVYGILACGMTLVIISGGIDLAVGSVLALVAVVFSLASIHWGWSPWLVVPLCLAVGAACGGTSGILTASFRIQPFIATLAMMVFARGLAKTVSGGMKVSRAVQNPDGTYRFVDAPAIFRAINTSISLEDVCGWIPGIDVPRYVESALWAIDWCVLPRSASISWLLHEKLLSIVTVIFLASVAVTFVALARHRWGRHLYAIGGNEEAAWLSGIRVRWAKILAYAASGTLAAVAGICQAAQEGQGDPEAGIGYELSAIAIVVIGGSSLMGGRGGIGLTLIGTLTIGYLEKILSINAVPEAGRLMLTGVIIVAAVMAQKRGH